MTPWVRWVLLGLLGFTVLVVVLAFAGLDLGENALPAIGLPLGLLALVLALAFRRKMRQ